MVEEKTWWQRNRLWVIAGCGCLAVVCLCLALVAALATGIVGAVFGTMRSSDAYEMALEQARQHPAVVEALGEPVEAGWLVSGSTMTTGESGRADLLIPLSGPKGSGTLHVSAVKSGGQWRLQTLDLTVKGRGGRINVMKGGGK